MNHIFHLTSIQTIVDSDLINYFISDLTIRQEKIHQAKDTIQLYINFISHQKTRKNKMNFVWLFDMNKVVLNKKNCSFTK